MAASNWHIHAWCIRCDWAFSEQPGIRMTADLAARKHEEAENHSTSTGMHRLLYCETLGCPRPETVPARPS